MAIERLSIDEIIAHCERHTERCERARSREFYETEELHDYYMKEYWEHRQVAEYLKELKERRAQG